MEGEATMRLIARIARNIPTVAPIAMSFRMGVNPFQTFNSCCTIASVSPNILSCFIVVNGPSRLTIG